MTTPTGYSRTQIALHWAVAALVAGQYLLNDAIGSAWRAFVEGTTFAFDPMILEHIAAGVLILLLVVWRVTLRLTRGAPPPPEKEHPALKALAGAAHWGFYGVLALLTVSGGMAWFGGIQAAAGIHNLLKVLLLALIVLHVAAVIYHQLVLKTGLMQRMVHAES